MLTMHKTAELTQFFAIKSDLFAAFRAGNTEDAEFNIQELCAIQMHTDSERLRAACGAAIREFRRLPMPMIA